MLEYLRLSLFIIAITMAYAYMSNDDYHKRFDKPIEIQYNCSKLRYDTPTDVVTMCGDGRRFVVIKIYE